MNIGNTPQEQLAVIKYVHKRATIIGVMVAVFYVLLELGSMASFDAGDTNLVLASIVKAIITATVAFWYVRACTWSYYWVASRRNMKQLVAELLITADKDTVTYRVYGNSLVGTRGPGYLLLLIVSLVMGIVFGTYLAIKYIIMERKLKKQLGPEAVKIFLATKSAETKLSKKTVVILVCVGLVLLLMLLPKMRAINAKSNMAAYLAAMNTTTTTTENDATKKAITTNYVIFGQAMDTIAGTVNVPYGSQDDFVFVETQDDMEYAVIYWSDGWTYDSREGQYCKLDTPTRFIGDFYMDEEYFAVITIAFVNGDIISGKIDIVSQ